MSARLDLVQTGIWLLFYQTPTDRALIGWSPGTEVACPDIFESREDWLEWVADELED